jgi:hypothetical protein
MTLSPEPWLVLLSRLLSGYGNRAVCALHLHLGGTTRFPRRALLRRRLPTRVTGVRCQHFVSIPLAQFTLAANHFAFPNLLPFLIRAPGQLICRAELRNRRHPGPRGKSSEGFGAASGNQGNFAGVARRHQ